MVTRIGRRNFNLYAMDVESHNDKIAVETKETSIWLGCFIDESSKVNDESSYFYTIDEFLDRIEDLSKTKRKKNRSRICSNLCIYIYNLSFEWSFILPKLIERNFTPHLDVKNNDYSYNSISTRSVSSVWEVNLKFGSNHGIIKLRDLAKIFSGSLSKVAKSFGLPTQKGSIDYTLSRRGNYIPTAEEKEYCFKDTRIIVDILQIMIERQDKDFFKAISAASYSMLKLIKTGFGQYYKPYQRFREIYPELSAEENEFLRQGVEGGITYAPDGWQFKVINQKILHIDMHQAHPSSAYANLFPHGKGHYFRGKPPIDKISAVKIRLSYSAVRLHSIIKLIGLSFVRDKEIVVWTPEIPIIKKCYVDAKIEYIEGYWYDIKPLPWRKYYSRNYFLRDKAKKEGDLFNIQYYKLLNNSSYGKLLEKPHNQIFENVIGKDGLITSIVKDKEADEIEANAKYTYLPVGSLIPAYTRIRLITTALKFGWEKIVYFDTDSIFVLYDEDTQRIWDTEVNQKNELTGWGLEEIIDKAQFLAPKRYKTEVNGKTTVKAAGINFEKYLKDNEIQDFGFATVDLVESEWMVQRAFRVKGGTIIDYQKKEISVQKKYKEIYEHNVGNNNQYNI